jgi:hypothetical protein
MHVLKCGVVDEQTPVTLPTILGQMRSAFACLTTRESLIARFSTFVAITWHRDISHLHPASSRLSLSSGGPAPRAHR